MDAATIEQPAVGHSARGRGMLAGTAIGQIPAVASEVTITEPAAVKTINLALQGGGAHDALPPGVLDLLLEDERIAFEGVAATSAGAMNAVVLAYGLAEGGRDGAKKALNAFWRRVSHATAAVPLPPSPIDRMLHNHTLEYSPVCMVMA